MKKLLFFIALCACSQIWAMKSNKKRKIDTTNKRTKSMPALNVKTGKDYLTTSPQKALSHLELAFRQTDDFQAKKEAILLLGHLHMFCDNLDKANFCYPIALSLFEQPRMRANIQFQQGLIARRQNNLTTAKVFFDAVANQTAYPEIQPLAQKLFDNCKKQEDEAHLKKRKR